MPRFRQFINNLPCNFVIREEAPPNPDNSGTGDETHNDVSSALQFQLGIEPDAMKQHDSEDAVVIGKPFKFASKWGFLVKPPITATVKHLDDGNVEVTFLLSQLPKAHFFNYKDGSAPIAYEGPIEDKVEIMSKQDLEDIKATGLDQAGQMGGMGMGGPMGGDPMGGMGGMGMGM